MVSEGLVRGQWQQHEGLELRPKTAPTRIDGGEGERVTLDEWASVMGGWFPMPREP